MKLVIDRYDGRYTYKEPSEGHENDIDVIEISDEQFALWEEIARLDYLIQKQLRDLSNDQYKRMKALQETCEHPEWKNWLLDGSSDCEYCAICRDTRMISKKEMI